MKRILEEKSVLDEREMLDMYRIEHGGLWAMYMLLCAAVIVQLLLGAELVQMAGELAVLLLVSAGMIVAYAQKGIWDAHSRPSMKCNAAYSAVCAAAVALIVSAVRGSVWWGLAAGAAMFALCFALLAMTMALLSRRQRREDEALENDDELDS